MEFYLLNGGQVSCYVSSIIYGRRSSVDSVILRPADLAQRPIKNGRLMVDPSTEQFDQLKECFELLKDPELENSQSFDCENCDHTNDVEIDRQPARVWKNFKSFD